MSEIAFTVHSVPVAQPRQRSAVRFGRAVNYTPANHPVQAFKAAVQLAAANAYSGPPLECPLFMQAVFVMPRPSTKCWKKKPTPRYPHTVKPDADNLLKAVKDALSKRIYRDDSQVAWVVVKKLVAAGDEQPHVTITIKTIEDC